MVLVAIAVDYDQFTLAIISFEFYYLFDSDFFDLFGFNLFTIKRNFPYYCQMNLHFVCSFVDSDFECKNYERRHFEYVTDYFVVGIEYLIIEVVVDIDFD